MDDKQLMKTGMEIMLRPVTDIAENALGLAGGDWLSEKRARNRAKLKTKTEEILKQRNAQLDTDPSPSVVIPLLTAAQDEGRDELLDLWAALLAAASDPARRNKYRREYVEIVKELEPIDVLILRHVGGPQGQIPSGAKEMFCSENGLSADQFAISCNKLSKLELINSVNWGNVQAVIPTSLAREICRTVSD